MKSSFPNVHVNATLPRGMGAVVGLAAFDPTLPEDGALVVAEVLRDQFNGLHEMILDIPAGPPGPQGNPGIQGPIGPEGPEGPPGDVSEPQMMTAIWDYSAANVNAVDPLEPSVATTDYDPVQMQEVLDKLNELIQALKRV